MLEQLITLDQGQWCEVFRLAVLSQACVMFCPSEPLDSTGEQSLYCAKVLKISFSFARQRWNTSTFILSHCRTSNMGVATRFDFFPPGDKAWGESRQGRWQLKSYLCHSKAFFWLPAVPQDVCFPPPASAGRMRVAGTACTPSLASRALPWV